MTEIDEGVAQDGAEDAEPEKLSEDSHSGSLTDVTSVNMDESGRILVQATVNLSGLRFGQVARVDPTDPQIAQLLAKEFLVPIERRDGETRE